MGLVKALDLLRSLFRRGEEKPYKPYMRLTTGGVNYDFAMEPVSYTDEKLAIYSIEKPRVAFPDPAPQTGEPLTENYLPIRKFQLTPPFHVGVRRGADPHGVWDAYNVNSLFDAVTIGPLSNSPTQTAFASTFKVTQGAGFFEGNGHIIVYGDASAATNGEPAYYFAAASTTWTDCTLNADLTADVENITGITYAEGYWWAVADQLQSDGVNNRITYKSVGTSTPTAWERANTDVADESLGTTPFTPNRLRYVVYSASTRMSPGAARLYSISWASASNRAMLTMRATTDPANWDDGANQEMESTSTPRGLTLFPGEDGVTDVIAATNVALYRGNLSGANQIVEELYRFGNPSSSYTGALAVLGDYLYFSDGPILKRLRWLDGNGKREVEFLELEVPLEASGDITAIATSKERSWVYIERSGLAASRNARIYVFKADEPDPAKAWHCFYRHATAQRALPALVESSRNDGVVRLHSMVEAAAGGDQDAINFARITSNPTVDTAYTFAATDTGVIRTTRFNANNLTLSKGFAKYTIVGDGFDADETVTVKFASNGGSLGSASSAVVASPTSLWTDGSGAIGTSALDMDAEITMQRGSTNTNSPKIAAMAWEYQMPGLKSDGTVVETFRVRVSLDTADYKGRGERPKSAKDARDTVRTLAGTVTLLAFLFGEDVVTAKKVRMVDYTLYQHIGEKRSSGVPLNEYGFADLYFTEEV